MKISINHALANTKSSIITLTAELSLNEVGAQNIFAPFSLLLQFVKGSHIQNVGNIYFAGFLGRIDEMTYINNT